MMDDDVTDAQLERRPAAAPRDTRLASEVATAYRELLVRYPGCHICGDYRNPLYVVLHVVERDGTSLDDAEVWIAR